MIIHDFTIPVRKVKIDISYSCLILVLVIPQIGTSVTFLFNFKLRVVPGGTMMISKQIVFLEVLRNPKHFWIVAC